MPDFNPLASDLHVGIEVEFPEQGKGEYLVNRGNNSNSLRERVSNSSIPDGRAVYDGTVGLEIVSDVLEIEDAANWYRSVLDVMYDEYNAKYQPTGLLNNGSTAGTHVHISPISQEQALQLKQLSQEEWMQIMFCSSIANEDNTSTWPVFRGQDYCRFEYDNDIPSNGMSRSAHYECVNKRGSGHYEWRLPEPMIPEHMEIMTRFLRLFFDSAPEVAIEYAQELLDNADDRITSIRRAEAVGMAIDDVPIVTREKAPVDPNDFYESVVNDHALPNIYQMEYDSSYFYILDSELNFTHTIDNVTFDTNDVLNAGTLERVDDPELRTRILQMFSRQAENIRETDATKELKKIIKKK